MISSTLDKRDPTPELKDVGLEKTTFIIIKCRIARMLFFVLRPSAGGKICNDETKVNNHKHI